MRTYPYEARLVVDAAADEVARLIPGAIGIVASEGSSTVVEVGSTSMERMVRYLAGLPCACSVLHPPELRRALLHHVEQLAAANR